MTLDPQVKAFLHSLKEMNLPPRQLLSVEEKRQQLASYLALQGEERYVAMIKNVKIPVKDGEIWVRIYTPEGDGPFPIFIYLHGGGWVIGDLEIGNTLCRNIANLSGCIVVSVDYRLSPEYKFPIPVDDCFAAVEWVEKNAAKFNGDPSKIAIGGDSAGGNLAAAVSLIARDRGSPSIKYQVLIYPVTNLDFNTRSYIENGEGYVLTRDSMIWYAQQYLNSEKEMQNVQVAPFLAENLEGLPPALILTAQYDPLKDDGASYASRLIQAGVNVEYKYYSGMIHGFLWMTGIIDEGKKAVQLIANRLQSNLNESSYEF